jgi:hypothetical protein
VSRIEQEQPEEATAAFTDLLTNIPNSEFGPKAKEYLEKLGRPIPTASANATPVTPDRPGMMGRIGLILGKNDLTISEDGVLVSSKGDTKEDSKKSAEKSAEATGVYRHGARSSPEFGSDFSTSRECAGDCTGLNACSNQESRSVQARVEHHFPAGPGRETQG